MQKNNKSKLFNKSSFSIRKDEAKLAVVLDFEEKIDTAPRVSSVGQRKRAEEIRRLARRYGIPVHKDKQIAQLLSEVPEESFIPEDLYDAVAKVMVSSEKKR